MSLSITAKSQILNLLADLNFADCFVRCRQLDGSGYKFIINMIYVTS
jgi:hypothetical protein